VQVIATAGHVDHGKSTLVELLTGMQPDRWAEERRRGLTIGLGYAWTELPDIGEVAFVDVPGHERFVPTMLAGVGPVPAVLFVVAADGGWMPQSTEHLAALHALGVRHGLLVITRSDLADPAPARRDALARIGETSLGAVDSVVVSSRTGAGIDDLRGALVRLLGSLPAPDPTADVRLWIDRSFSISGAGTVVTGTLTAGTLHHDQELQLAGSGEVVRVRGLQALGTDASEVPALARVAVNLRGVKRGTVAHGDALLTPDAWLRTTEIDVALRGDAAGELPRELMLHIGSAAVTVRVRPLGERTARLRLATALPLRVGDRVLLRDPGRHRIGAGAVVLDVTPPPLTRRGDAARRDTELAALADAPRTEVAETLLRRRRFLAPATLLAMGLPLAGKPIGPDWLADPRTWAELVTELPVLLDTWRAEHPLETGMPVEVVRQRTGLPAMNLVERLATAAGLSVVDGRVTARERRDLLPERVEIALAGVTADLARTPFVAPDANRLAELGLGGRELAAAVRAGRLLKVTDGIVLLPGADQQAGRVLARLDQPFTLSAARQALNTTRRVAVPLLELLDRTGVTERLPDNTRRVRRPADGAVRS
jgi:selenocysteine-specific elongation factor